MKAAICVVHWLQKLKPPLNMATTVREAKSILKKVFVMKAFINPEIQLESNSEGFCFLKVLNAIYSIQKSQVLSDSIFIWFGFVGSVYQLRGTSSRLVIPVGNCLNFFCQVFSELLYWYATKVVKNFTSALPRMLSDSELMVVF